MNEIIWGEVLTVDLAQLKYLKKQENQEVKIDVWRMRTKQFTDIEALNEELKSIDIDRIIDIKISVPDVFFLIYKEKMTMNVKDI